MKQNKVNLDNVDFLTINSFKYIPIPLKYCKPLHIGYSYSPYEPNDVVCMSCNGNCQTANYVGVYNDVLCDNCLNPVLQSATYYEEDSYYEDKNIRRMGLAFQYMKEDLQLDN